MNLGGGKALKGFKQEVVGTHLLYHSRDGCLDVYGVNLLAEGQRQSGYDCALTLSGPLWSKHMELWGHA